SFDSVNGLAVGAEVADYAIEHFLKARDGRDDDERGGTNRDAVIGSFGPKYGFETSLPTLMGGVSVDSPAQGKDARHGAECDRPGCQPHDPRQPRRARSGQARGLRFDWAR